MLFTKQLSKIVESQQDSTQQKLTILHQVDMLIQSGETVAIVGPSGSGKSTLLGLLAGLDTPSSGQVSLAGHELSTANEDQRAEIRAEKVGFVFQSFQLIQGLNALENVMLPLELKSENDAQRLATEILGRVGLADRLSHFPSQLSGGEQQRVAIARAFVSTPTILFADEPTGNLDKKTAETIINLLFEINQENNTTLVLVTHDVQLAEKCARQIRLEGGKIVA
ncbi:MAG: ABC transporter ATP-binding protein [Thiohalomonadales bacterium]